MAGGGSRVGPYAAAVAPDRAALLDRSDLRGRAWCEAYSDAVDEWLRALLADASDGRELPVALVAVGGYGRRELSPGSDLDLLLVHPRRFDAAPIADRIWYPVWDAGLHLGHKVATVAQVLALAKGDLDTATSLLSARTVAGDPALADAVLDGGRSLWRSGARGWLDALRRRVEERHLGAADVAFAMEPDLKDGRGGMRDVHSLWWAEEAPPTGDPLLTPRDRAELQDAYDVLLAARVELQRGQATARPSNVLTVADRERVAAGTGRGGGDDLAAEIARAGRVIAWTSDDTWRRAARLLTRRGRTRATARVLRPGIEERDGEVHVDDAVAGGPGAALVVAAVAAAHDLPLSRDALDRLAERSAPIDTWTPARRDDLLALLLAGRPAVAAIEALDRFGLWAGHVLPEWQGVRARPQHRPHHRFTVDRHILETVASAATQPLEGTRRDLLVLAALLHDLGKGTDADDHVEAGTTVARAVLARLGLPDDDVDIVVGLVRHHLLLLDLATRRDLDDPVTLQVAAEAVGDGERLDLLAALSRADAEATGPAAWTPWRAELLAGLVHRVAHLLATGSPPPLDDSDGEQLLAALQRGEPAVEVGGDAITVVTDDRPGVFSRVAGVLALHGLEVRSAAALSSDTGLAASRFRVVDPLRDEPPWPRVRADVQLALAGRLALHARLAERDRTYRRRRRGGTPPPTRVEFDDAASATSTVLDVFTADREGVLHRVTAALAELDLDIRSARVQTVGHEVVDAFYIRDRLGGKVEDPALRAEIVLAVTHALGDDRSSPPG
jgi:[protein-PII] uridylyltransferase